MRDIAHGFFMQSPAMAGPIVALLIFFIVFVVIARRVARTRAADWTEDAALPLSDGTVSRTDSNQGTAP